MNINNNNNKMKLCETLYQQFLLIKVMYQKLFKSTDTSDETHDMREKNYEQMAKKLSIIIIQICTTVFDYPRHIL